MNHNSKIKIFLLIIFGFLVFLITPRAIAAEDKTGSMCVQLQNINNRIQNRLKTFDDELGPKHPKGDLKQVEESASQKLTIRRSDWDKLRAQHYEKLKERAKTEAQQQAVADYKESIEAAVSQRRSKVDEALVAFRSTLDGLVDDNQNTLEQLVQTYKESVASALQRAQSSCDNGDSAESVRTNLSNDLKAAREQLQSTTSKVQEDIEVSRKVREGTISGAIDEFKQAAQNARQTLEQALGQ